MVFHLNPGHAVLYSGVNINLSAAMIHKLEADGIQLSFDTRHILTDVYFKCETGSITGILGRNGEGKTCLMNIIYGSMEAQSKSIRFDNNSNIEAFKRADLLTYLPQFNFIPKQLSLKRVFADFELSFPEFMDHFPDYKTNEKQTMRNLSGGERRLIEVYVLIKSRSQFTMLDEPFSHIMPVYVEKIKELLVSEKAHKGFIITDHLYRQIIDSCDRLYVLANGRLHLTKSVEDIETLGYARL
jgi:ABC-type lipopolysaccharide export system ATPase subunit